jgi:hypothetical protein
MVDVAKVIPGVHASILKIYSMSAVISAPMPP